MKPTTFNLTVTDTTARCPSGETIGQRNAKEGAVPVLSCEGACIRGEIARLAANRVAQAPGFRRACHGELFAVPHSAMASWVRGAEQVLVIDGCHLKCHARIIEHLVDPKQLRSFDALGHYRKFSDRFDIDSVPEAERKTVADDVAEWVLAQFERQPAPAAAGCACTARNEEDAGCDAPRNDTPRSAFTSQVHDLVGIGASVAANCEPCLEHHVRQAERHGITREDVARAAALGAKVKDAPHQRMLAAMTRLTAPAENESEPSSPTASCCVGAGQSTAPADGSTPEA